MSMLGIRDLSIIETAPTNRYPVQTYVMETNPGLIREAKMCIRDRTYPHHKNVALPLFTRVSFFIHNLWITLVHKDVYKRQQEMRLINLLVFSQGEKRYVSCFLSSCF